MPYVVIAVVLIFFSVIVGIRRSFAQGSEKPLVTSQKVTGSTRGQLNEMLKLIEAKDAPEQKMGAMCYKVAVSPEYQEYVCPIDAEKTIYDTKKADSYWIVKDIVEMRRLPARINAATDLADISLDERRLCHKCMPPLTADQRYVSLVVKYPDKREYVYEKVTVTDLRILLGFFEKKLTYTTDNDAEIPLKGELGRIKKMLGTLEQGLAD